MLPRLPERLSIVLGNAGSLLRNPAAGGHWSVRLHYLLGLAALGHRATLLELGSEADAGLAGAFVRRMARYGVSAVVLLTPDGEPPDLGRGRVVGATRGELRRIVSGADLLINDCGWVRQPLLSSFKRSAYLDLDPGLVQATMDATSFNLYDNHVFLTCGGNVGKPGALVPTLGVEWRAFLPVVYLPLWKSEPLPARPRGLTSVTQWNWNSLWVDFRGHLLSDSKRDAYLEYVGLPRRAAQRFQLALNYPDAFDAASSSPELPRLKRNGWNPVQAEVVAATVGRYRRFIAESVAEFLCPKPVYVQLRTGWISDRSACYLASGRPVIARDTGFSENVPVGEGLVAFTDLDSAVDGVRRVTGAWKRHSAAARRLAEDLFDSRRALPAILDACA